MTRTGWIVRIITGRTKGWQARVPFGKVNPDTKARRYKSKLFSDLLHGGSNKAKAAAEKWLKATSKKR